MPIPKSPWRRREDIKGKMMTSQGDKRGLETKIIDDVRVILQESRKRDSVRAAQTNNDIQHEKIELNEDDRKGGHGLITFFLFVVFLAGISGTTLYFIGEGQGLWRNLDEYISGINDGKFVEIFRQGKNPTSGRDRFVNRPKMNLPPEVTSQVSQIERKMQNGEISTKQAKRMIEDLYDPFLGSGKTRKIMDITERQLSGEISERQATREIINEVPTGLPKPVDNFIKNFSLGVVGKSLDNQ